MRRYFLEIAMALLLLGCSKEGTSRPGHLTDKPLPQFIVQKWVTAEPDRAGKFILIDFWATWCAPCVANIPELNEIHEKFKDKVAVIGVSAEDEGAVRGFTERNIEYFVAVDTQSQMKRQLGIHYIPYVIVVDPKGIIRWEGHPGRKRTKLNDQVIDRIIKDYEGASGSAPISRTSNKQSIKDFFSYVICESGAMQEHLASPNDFNIFPKVEKELDKFGIHKNDIVKVMNADTACFMMNSIADNVREKCGSRYTREQILTFVVNVKLSLDTNVEPQEKLEIEDLFANHPEALKKYRQFGEQKKLGNRKRAEKGDVAAQAELGSTLYFKDKNYKEAFMWTKKAADGGSAKAASELGLMYLNGEGVAQNDHEAARWFQAAIDRGEKSANIYLSSLYFEGKGVRKDLEKSMELSKAGVLALTGKDVSKDHNPISSRKKESLKKNGSPVSMGLNIIVLLLAFCLLSYVVIEFVPREMKPYLLPLVFSMLLYIGFSGLFERTHNALFKSLVFFSPIPLVLVYIELKLRNIFKRKFRKHPEGAWICRKCGEENATLLLECHNCKAPFNTSMRD